jgi:hypothetical protein
LREARAGLERGKLVYTIRPKGVLRRTYHLRSADKISISDFDNLAADIRQRPRKVRKVGLVAACRATERRIVHTCWESEVTTNVAEPGDWIVTNLDKHGAVLRDRSNNQNTYVVKAASFDRIYMRAAGEDGEFGPLFKARAQNVVEALYFADGFDILAPWNHRQTADAGYLLRNGPEVYGNERTAFEATYEDVA